MKIIRKITVLIMIVIGTLALLTGLQCLFGDMVEQTLEHSKQIETLFQNASDYVVSFRKDEGRLPTEQEFEIWINTFTQKPNSSHNNMWLKNDLFPEKALKEFGPAPDDSFLLVYWRGEWDEYYASWANRTSLEFDKSKYYISGNKYADGISFICIALIALVGSIKLWPNQRINSDGKNACGLEV